MKKKLIAAMALVALWVSNVHLSTVHAQGTAFSYQGRLNTNDSPATGRYDFIFALWSTANSGGSLGSPQFVTNVAVSSGLFNVALDFGNQFPGADRWLSIEVCTNGSGAYVTLAPRQKITPAPYTIYSATAGSATTAVSANSIAAANITGTLALNQLPAGTLTNGSSGVNLTGAFTGNGGGLTNLNGTNLTVGSVGRTQLASGTLASPISVAGTNLTVTANTSYLATNSSPTAFQLPFSPNIGDVVEITGAGTGGWATLKFSPGGTNWQQAIAPDPLDWKSLASSADGSRVIGAASGSIYISTNSGVSWARSTTPSGNWSCVASSTNGLRLIAAGSNWGIILSTNGGTTWAVSSAPATSWFGTASSADGSRLVAITFGGGIFTSANFGANWTQTTAPSLNWVSVASSADGTRLIAVNIDQFNSVYTSIDSGTNWTLNDLGTGFDTLTSVASSADGARLIGGHGADVFTSTNSGTTWTKSTLTAAITQGNVVASSTDGTRLVAALGGAASFSSGGIYVSTNSGATWTQTDAPIRTWKCVASSADGSRLVAGMYSYPTNGIFVTGSYNVPFSSGPQGSRATLEYVGNGQWVTVRSPETSSNTANTTVTRDANGNFSAGVITATLAGNAATATVATTATNFSGALTGDVTGTQNATVVSTVQGLSASIVTNGASLANAASSANTANAMVRRDASGNFSAGTVTATLSGNAATATIATTATNFSGALTGDVTGTQSSTVVSSVQGLTASIVTNGASLANAATSANTSNAIVKRDASGNFSAGTITTTGKVGVGTNNPAVSLHIKQTQDSGGFNANNDGIQLEAASGNYWVLQTQGQGDLVFGYNNASGNAPPFCYIGHGNGQFVTASDARFKKNVQPLGDTLEKALQLRPVTFQYNQASDDSKPVVGFIAQEVQELFPDTVDTKDGYMAVAYSSFGPIAIGAIKELNQKVDERNKTLEAENAQLKQQNETITSRLEKLEAAVKALSENK